MKKKEYILQYDMLIGTVFSAFLLFFMIFLTYLLDKNMLSDFISSIVDENMIIYFLVFYILMFAWMILHEIIHGVAYRLNGASKNDIVYGAALEKGVFYCKCRNYINKKCILISLISPFLFIGVFTYILGFLFESGILVVLSIINISGAAFDLLMFVFMVKQDEDIEFKELGFSSPFCLRTKRDLTNLKFIGIKSIHLVKDKNETIEPQEKKITISKYSWGFVIAIFLMIGIITLLSLFC